MPLVQGSSRQAISENIRREMGAHKPLKQAIAIALDVARRNRAEGGRAEDIGYAPDVPSTAARDVGYAPDASPPGQGDEDYLRQLAILAPPAQPRPLNMLGDALYGLGRSLSGPAANPIKPAQDAAYGAFKGVTVDPVVEAYNAVKGRMTEDEQRDMLFGAALGITPLGRGARVAPVRSFGRIRELLGEHDPLYVRWSSSLAHDMSPGAVSRDYQSGQRHAGLSALPLTADISDDNLFKFLRDYSFLVGPNRRPTKPRLFAGDRVGYDTDGSPVIIPKQHFGTLSNEFIKFIGDDINRQRMLLAEQLMSGRKALDFYKRSPPDNYIPIWTPEIVAKIEDDLAKLGGPVRLPGEPLRGRYAEGGRADEKPKTAMPRPNPFRSQPLSSSSRPPLYGTLAQSYGNLERQMGNPEIDRVMLGLDRIKNYPELRPTTQQDLDKYWAGRGEFYRTINKLRMDPDALDRMPQSDNIEYRWPVTPDDLYGDKYVREPLGAIRNYASGGRTGQAIQRAGLITSTVPGRTDKHSINVLSGSYILPADHVAHLGQDNSLAGGKVLDSMFGASRKSPPASGDIVPIVVAGGEYLLEPDQVESVGNGDLTRGHNALDAWVKSARKKHVSLLKSLPPPKTK